MSEITATLTKKIGPLPAWSYAVIGGGLGLLFLLKKKPTAQAAVGTGTLPLQSIGTGSGGSGGGDSGSGGTGTGTGTVTPPPLTAPDPNAPAFSENQYHVLAMQYEQAIADMMNGGLIPDNNGMLHTSPITPAPSNPISIPPQVTYMNPVGPAGPVTPNYTQAPFAYNQSYQMPNPPMLHYIGGPLGGMNLPAQVASAVSGPREYIGGPLNGQFL